MIYFPIFSPYEDRLLAVSTTRNGGVSTGNYSSMNLCHYVEDSPDNVAKNKYVFCNIHRIDPNKIIFPQQTHGDKIIHINTDFLQQPENVRQKLLYGMDAIITGNTNICIGISTADCVPVLFYDNKKQVIGAAHAGWRGTATQIVAKTVRLMTETFNTNPKDIIAVIGPCISKRNYEVGDELYDTFNKAGFPAEQLFSRNPKTNKYHLDLREANKRLLIETGISQDNIYISDLCTFENSDIVFSARKSGINSGRIASCMMLR